MFLLYLVDILVQMVEVVLLGLLGLATSRQEHWLLQFARYLFECSMCHKISISKSDNKYLIKWEK